MLFFGLLCVDLSLRCFDLYLVCFCACLFILNKFCHRFQTNCLMGDTVKISNIALNWVASCYWPVFFSCPFVYLFSKININSLCSRKMKSSLTLRFLWSNNWFPLRRYTLAWEGNINIRYGRLFEFFKIDGKITQE